MSVSTLEPIVSSAFAVLALYAAVGLAFAAMFHAFGAAQVDPATRGAGVFFRMLITPGVVAFWPLLAARWLRARREGAAQVGSVHRPLSATALRSLHRRLAAVLIAVVPLGAAAGILLRPARPQPDPRVRSMTSVSVPMGAVTASYDAPFAALPIVLRLRAQAAERQLELEIARDLEIPTLALYWMPAGGETFPRSAVFLGEVWGPGTRRFDFPSSLAGRPGELVLYSVARDQRIASFVIPIDRPGD